MSGQVRKIVYGMGPRGKNYSKNNCLTIKGTVKFTVTIYFIVNDTVKINKIQYDQQ